MFTDVAFPAPPSLDVAPAFPPEPIVNVKLVDAATGTL